MFLKNFRPNFLYLKLKKILISIIANILDPIFRYFPKHSFNFLAYKIYS